MSAAVRPVRSFDASRAGRAVKFIERLLRHTKDRWSGQPFILTQWQREEIIEPLFGTVRPDGTRQYRTAYISTARKNGKTELGAAIALYLLFADGVDGAEIYSAAGDRDQASLVFSVAADMVEMSPILSQRAKVLRSHHKILDLKTRSTYRAVSSDAPRKHGLNASGIIFDELHTQRTRELWDVMRTAMRARREPLLVALTTAGYDQTSICYEQYRYGHDVARGLKNDPSYFFFCREAAPDDDWTDETIWRKANPALGQFISISEMREEFEAAKQLPARQNTFRNLYLNQWVQQKTRAVDLGSWDACAVADLPGSDKPSYGALDLSETTDLTAFALVTEIPGDPVKYKLETWFWLPSDPAPLVRARRDGIPWDAWHDAGHIRLCDGPTVEYGRIVKEIGEICTSRNLKSIAFDRWGSLGVWQALKDEGHNVVQFGQGFASMSAPCKELLSLIVSRNLLHDGCPVMRYQANCLETVSDPAGNIKFVKPDRRKSASRIDGFVAAAMALAQAMGGQSRKVVSIFSPEVFRQWQS